MILCLDVGNTTIHGGVFEGTRLRFQFRRTSEFRASSDEIGLFLRSVLRENGIPPEQIQDIALCSVVPDAIHSMRSACRKYFHRTPFILTFSNSNGVKIDYPNPSEVGSDRLANTIAALERFPGQDLLVVDFGTATTFDVVSRDRHYLGGVIVAGIRISMEALEARTARLPSVEIVARPRCLGQSTVECIQSGLYFGNVGMVKEISSRLIDECFGHRSSGGVRPLLIATGGFSSLFDQSGLFDFVIPELVLNGLRVALIRHRALDEGPNES